MWNKEEIVKKIIAYGIIIILIGASFSLFGIQLNKLFEEQIANSIISDAVTFDAGSIGLETDSEGTSFVGSITFFDSDIEYDTIYDDDTTGDGYRDRRSYYLNDNLVFASWDEDADWLYETSMTIADGMYVESEVTDTNNDGLIDTLTTFSNDGEELTIKSDLIGDGSDELIEETDDRKLSADVILLITLPLLLGIVFSGVLIVLIVKDKRSKKITSALLCFLILGSTLAYPVHASELYDENGNINQKVFDTNWEKYSDIDDGIPIEQRSYEAKEYGNAEQRIRSLYKVIYQTTVDQELNRLSYVDLVNYKKSIDTTQKYNLIKSTIRLAAFTGYTVNDSAGKGKSFAENILKSGATLVKQIDDVLTVTSDFVTDSYKESFETLEKLYKYSTSDNITKDILEDMKSEVKDQVSIKIDETIDEVINRKKIPDYTVDDLKISDADIQILKSHYDESRDIQNAILQNRKVHSQYKYKLDNSIFEILAEMNKLDIFRNAEKERVYNLLLKDKSKDTNEEIELLEQGSSDLLDTDNDTVEENELSGTWVGTFKLNSAIVTNMPKNTTQEMVNTQFRVGKQLPMKIEITKEQGIYSAYMVDDANDSRLKADSVNLQENFLTISFYNSIESILMTTILYGEVDWHTMKFEGTYEINNNSKSGLHCEGEFIIAIQN